ncbi:MAG: ATP-dependent helicase [Oscillospiraceae bacterium]
MPSHNYIELKKIALKKFFGFLNPQQQEAVFNINGPQVVLAGAGSGKTSVIVNRIINMVTFGNAFYDEIVQGSNEDIKSIENFIDGTCEDVEPLRRAIAVTQVKPWNIVAITFTNKSANELKERLYSALGEQATMVHASTFHSLCVKILRRYIHLCGYNNDFTIYDADESKKIIKNCLIELDIPEQKFPPKTVLSIISTFKNRLISTESAEKDYQNDYRMRTISKIYSTYQEKLLNANAIDFDDIIKITVELFQKYPDVLQKYRNMFKYIMVDEYQDTNFAQFMLISLLSSEHQNICVVGDDDQSIYGFRGADVSNILNFEKVFSNTKVIKLEQNYRSTKNILSCANDVISNNENRTDKKLWTANGTGDLVTLYKAFNESDEASYICKTIKDLVKSCKSSYNKVAILYRVNALSNAMEKTLIKEQIPYKVYGGTKFYERKEIKDIIAYLSVINNPNDMLRLNRIINEPKRGIGDATLEVIQEISNDLKISPIEVMRNASEYTLLAKKSTSLKNVVKMFDYLTLKCQTMMLDEFIDILLEKTGYDDYLTKLGDEGEERRANIMELKSNIVQYIKSSDNPTLNGFLENVSLYTDIDTLNDKDDFVSLMTIHNSKGLEFDNVFIIGMEEKNFPSLRSLDDLNELEEERRICYVAMTRAKKRLYLSTVSQRMLYGTIHREQQSRFINEISSDHLNKISSSNSSNYNNKRNKTNMAYQSFTLQQQLAKKKLQERVVSTPQNTQFSVGDTVLHAIFGSGTVISVEHVGGDCMLKVDFDKVGLKTIMTNYTKIKKVNQR